jgi:hypothetical protein
MNPEPECKCQHVVRRTTPAGSPYTGPCDKSAALCKVIGKGGYTFMLMRLCESHRSLLKRTHGWEVEVL